MCHTTAGCVVLSAGCGGRSRIRALAPVQSAGRGLPFRGARAPGKARRDQRTGRPAGPGLTRCTGCARRGRRRPVLQATSDALPVLRILFPSDTRARRTIRCRDIPRDARVRHLPCARCEAAPSRCHAPNGPGPCGLRPGWPRPAACAQPRHGGAMQPATLEQAQRVVVATKVCLCLCALALSLGKVRLWRNGAPASQPFQKKVPNITVLSALKTPGCTRARKRCSRVQACCTQRQIMHQHCKSQVYAAWRKPERA